MKRLEDLVELINNSDEWSLEANRMIEENGWIDNTGETYGVCSDGPRKVVLNEDGKASIIETVVLFENNITVNEALEIARHYGMEEEVKEAMRNGCTPAEALYEWDLVEFKEVLPDNKKKNES